MCLEEPRIRSQGATPGGMQGQGDAGRPARTGRRRAVKIGARRRGQGRLICLRTIPNFINRSKEKISQHLHNKTNDQLVSSS